MTQASTPSGGLDPNTVRAIAERAATFALRELERERVREERRQELRERITAYLDRHPGASANEVFRALGGNRRFVLEAVRALRSPGAAEVEGSAAPEPESSERPVLVMRYHDREGEGRS